MTLQLKMVTCMFVCWPLEHTKISPVFSHLGDEKVVEVIETSFLGQSPQTRETPSRRHND